ncbi:Asp23/Gls24 family envelope stress response protein [Arthrobacter sp. NPDC090010]|uniref:Asp23/Gls24 family envelope stress response protein n=1 Tax=Arthrobacter sp. NPDC090010 TaxID=3363942 RepID=UPI0037F5F522
MTQQEISTEAMNVPERGNTRIPAAVLAKIAAQAAREIDGVGAAAGGVLGVAQRRDFDRRPQAEVELLGSTAVVRLDLGLRYPAPLESTCEAVRRHVDARLRRDAGVTRTQVDITVTWLHPEDPNERRRLL